jgi:hypothetical protein
MRLKRRSWAEILMMVVIAPFWALQAAGYIVGAVAGALAALVLLPVGYAIGYVLAILFLPLSLIGRGKRKRKKEEEFWAKREAQMLRGKDR